VAATMW